MSKFVSRAKLLLLCASATVATVGATPASAVSIVLNPDSSFTSSPNGAAALLGFQKAANYWSTVLTNDATISFDIHFDALDDGVLGGTYSNYTYSSTSQVYQQLATTGTSSLDSVAVANLRPLTAAGGLGMRVPGTDPDGNMTTTLASSRYDSNDSFNNTTLVTNTAVAKALGFAVDYDDAAFAGASFLSTNVDGDITFSSNFDFDFDPTDGIDVGAYDFVGVAVHEIGHALGFVSGTDDYDYYISHGGLTAEEGEDNAFATTLDLFRYATNGFDPDGSRSLQLDPNREAFFSIDGENPFNFNNQAEATSSFFATGYYLGDGNQASHWKDTQAILLANGCYVDERQVGIMDPTSSNCSLGIVTSNDLAAFDAMGWNLNMDILNNKAYTFNTAQIFDLPFRAVPEAATWMQMIFGFGMIGSAMRRRMTMRLTRA